MFVIKKTPTNVGNVFDLYSIFYGIVMFLALVLASLFNFLQFFSDFSSFSDFCLLSHGPPAPICPLIHLFSVAHWGLGSSPKPAPPALLDGHQSISYPAGRLNPSSGGASDFNHCSIHKVTKPYGSSCRWWAPTRTYVANSGWTWLGPIGSPAPCPPMESLITATEEATIWQKRLENLPMGGQTKRLPHFSTWETTESEKEKKRGKKPKHELYLEEMVQ